MNIFVELLFVKAGSDCLGEFSSENHNLESVEIGEVLSKSLLLESLATSVLREFLKSL